MVCDELESLSDPYIVAYFGESGTPMEKIHRDLALSDDNIFKFVHSDQPCWGESIVLKSMGTKYQYEGQAKMADLLDFIKPKLVPSGVFELEEKYERVIFDLE